MHGAWSTFQNSNNIRFHWTGDNNKAKDHIFQQIAGTTVYVLTHVNNVVTTNAIVTVASSTSTESFFVPQKRGRSG